MNSRETLIFQALKFKSQHTGSVNSFLLDAVLGDSDYSDPISKITRNVCAMVPIELANEMDQLCGILEMSKREMITLAITDFLDKARDVLVEFDAMPKGEA